MSWNNNRLCDLLGIENPIIQAPMAGATSPEMVVAACNAGALGSLGSAEYTSDKLIAEFDFIRAHTNAPFNANFFTHDEPNIDPVKGQAARERLKSWYDGYELGKVPEAIPSSRSFHKEICDTVCELKPAVVSFHFGLPDAKFVAQIKSCGIKILCSATSVNEAIWLEQNGVDAIIAQGFEAGGHSGWFMDRNGADLTGMFALVPRIVDAVSVPVIAAGGIMDGRGVVAALVLGASGVQLGTAFISSPESLLSDVHKKAASQASGDDTVHSTAFSGRKARSIVNKYASEFSSVSDWPEFPIGNTLSKPLRKASSDRGLPDAMSLWAGQAVGLNQSKSTTEIIENIVGETKSILSDFR